MAQRYIPVDRVIYQASTQLGIKNNIPWADMIEWVADAEEAIGTGMVFYEKPAVIEVENYQGILPSDFISIINAYRVYDATVTLSAGKVPSTWNAGQLDKTQYVITDSFIRTDYQTGWAGLYYQARMVDERGFPMVVDTREHREACVTYIAYRIMYIKYFRGDEDATESKLNRLWSQWQYYCKQARGMDHMPDYQRMEGIGRQWMRMIPAISGWANNKSLFDSQEQINME